MTQDQDKSQNEEDRLHDQVEDAQQLDHVQPDVQDKESQNRSGFYSGVLGGVIGGGGLMVAVLLGHLAFPDVFPRFFMQGDLHGAVGQDVGAKNDFDYDGFVFRENALRADVQALSAQVRAFEGQMMDDASGAVDSGDGDVPAIRLELIRLKQDLTLLKTDFSAMQAALSGVDEALQDVAYQGGGGVSSHNQQIAAFSLLLQVQRALDEQVPFSDALTVIETQFDDVTISDRLHQFASQGVMSYSDLLSLVSGDVQFDYVRLKKGELDQPNQTSDESSSQGTISGANNPSNVYSLKAIVDDPKGAASAVISRFVKIEKVGNEQGDVSANDQVVPQEFLLFKQAVKEKRYSDSLVLWAALGQEFTNRFSDMSQRLEVKADLSFLLQQLSQKIRRALDESDADYRLENEGRQPALLLDGETE